MSTCSRSLRTFTLPQRSNMSQNLSSKPPSHQHLGTDWKKAPVPHSPAMVSFRPFPFSCVPPQCIWRWGTRRDMKEVDAASSVVMMKTKEVAKSCHGSFPIRLGGLYSLCRHHLCHEGQQTPSRPPWRKKSPSVLQL